MSGVEDGPEPGYAPTETGEAAEPVEIDPSLLTPGALLAVIEQFVLREGTDYGPVEATLDSKVADVRRQLERGEARIVYDPVTESVTLVPV